MKNTKIEWADHTFNAWEGCTKVSPGCANCYAESRNHRYHDGKNWGKGAPRLVRSDAYWREPLKWNRVPWICPNGKTPMKGAPGGHGPYASDSDINMPCVECGSILRRPRVFCSSLADWLDEEGPWDQLARLLKLIYETPNLDWLLLTKRPENFKQRVVVAAGQDSICGTPAGIWAHRWWEGSEIPPNVWIGTSVEDQKRADERIPHLLNIPAKVRFLSCEPLLGPVGLNFPPGSTTEWVKFPEGFGDWSESKRQSWFKDIARATYIARCENGIHWVICGGESGPKARPMHPDWATRLRDQCQHAGVPFFMKQWGEYLPFTEAQTPEQKEAFSNATIAGFQSYFGACLVDGPEGPITGTTKGIRPVSYAKVGKKVAGRTLEGRTWDEFPHSIQPKP